MAITLGGGKRVLLVGGEGVVLYAPTSGAVGRETSISWEVPNFEEQLAETLGSRNQSKSVLVLFDGADQTYRKEENIPKMGALDRPRFIKRKLELAFPSYPIRAALEIKSGKGRGAPKVAPSFLFVALPETEQLDRIGTALYESGVPVAGFGLVPTESASLVTELSEKTFTGGAKKSRWCVLVGQHETGGLRQVVVKDGNLALTRLTPTSDAGVSGAGWVEEVMREFKATLTYLSRFGYGAEDGLDVIIICGNIEKQFFDAKGLAVTNFKCFTVTEALRQIGINSFGFEKSNFADVLHAAWAGKKTSLKLPVMVPSIHRVMAPRLAARIGAAALGVLALILFGVTVQSYFSYASMQDDISQKENQKTLLQREYDQESKVFDGLPVRPDALKATLAVKSLLETNSVDLPPVLHKLKDTLGEDVRLQELTFEHTPGPMLKIGAGSGGGGLFAAAADPKDKGKVRMTFKFGLPESMQLDDKVKRSNQLADDLRKAFPGYTVTITTQFGKVVEGGKFSGDTGSNLQPTTGSNGDAADFVMEGPAL